jgi:hypothetical protein
MVDKFIPWRLVADIGTSECIEYSKKYGLFNTNNILTDSYGRTDLIFFNKLKFYLLNLYNQNAKTYAESYDCNGVAKTRYVTIPKITIDQFDKIISEERILKLYFKIRMLEEDKKLSKAEEMKLVNDCQVKRRREE